MKKRFLAAAIFILFGGCSAKENTDEISEEYIAVYKVIEPSYEAEPVQPRVDVVFPDVYTYNYFDHLIIIGDEVCGGLTAHGLLSEERVFSIKSGRISELLSYELNEKSVESIIKEKNSPYIYLWAGAHDIFSSPDMTPDEFCSKAIETANQVREISPDSMVILMSGTPVSEVKGAGDKIQRYNSAICNAVKECDDKYIAYLDIFTPLSDANGFLNTAFDIGDGVNLSRAGCRRVMSTIENNRAYSELADDGKYKYLYKDIYAIRDDYTVSEEKTAYLTFDDGPSKYTPEILDVLSKNDIKATFFITGWCIDGKEDTLKRVAEEGHCVALHSWSHDYDEIYASPEAWLNDFSKVYNKVYDITGQRPWAFRFPGGSYNNFNKETADTIIAEMKRRGFSYYDWNCATSDAMSSATYESCIENLKDSVYSDHSVVLMHDSLKLTPQYLQEVIDFLKDEGYSFDTIQNADEVQF